MPAAAPIRRFAMAFSAFAALGCEAAGKPMEIQVFPTHCMVAGERFTDTKAAIASAVTKSPQSIKLSMCATATHKRVVEVTSLLQERFNGHLVMSSINAGEGECPNFSPRPDARR